MNNYIVKIVEARFITHDVKCFVVEKPFSYDFIPGQATDVAINLPEWEDQFRPFTFTSVKEDKYLEFTIKIYDDHDGVTNKLGATNEGAELIISDPFGAIQYKGPGVFIAAGAGITPFISIFRTLYQQKQLTGNRLIYCNKTAEDVILEAELQEMLNTDFIKVFTREHVIGFVGRRIDRDFLIENIMDFGQHFYLCGPDEFVKCITDLLLHLGAKPDTVIFEN
jgi:ferredoxin-NADP reductase